MATVNPAAGVQNISDDGSAKLIEWTPLTTTNPDGAPAEWAAWADRCVQVSGAFGTGGTLVIEGSNDGTNYVTLSDAQGVALSFTAAGLKQIAEVPRFLRPRVSAGSGAISLTVTLVLRRHNPMRT